MAIATNTFTTFSAIGIREDLSDIIYNISPEDTPFISNGGKGKAKQTLFEWQTDSLAAVDTANAALQGDDISGFDSVTATVRLGNRTQISRKTVIIADTEEVVDKAGRKSELAYQISKKSAELKRDMEAILLSNQGGATGSTTVKPTTASIQAFIKTNTVHDVSGSDPTYTSGVPPLGRTDSANTNTFTEANLISILSKIWVTSGPRNLFAMVGPVNKARISSTFLGIATRYRDVPAGKQASIVGAADVYVGNFGEITIVPNRFQRERDCLLLDPEYYEVDYLRPFQKVDLAKTGDAEKKMLIVEYGLRVKNEGALGIVADLQTS
jgi:hypothetical protein